MSANERGGWESGPRRRGPAPPGRLVCPVPPHHVAGKIVPPGAVRQPSGGRLEPTLPVNIPVMSFRHYLKMVLNICN
jgi:hypothetical protein